MARQRNVIKTIVLEVGDPDTIKKAADRVGKQVRDLRAELKTAVPKTAGVVRTQVIKPMIEKLRIYPMRWVGMKIRWKSERQRKFVMAMLRKDNNLPYKRTFKLRQGWEAVVEVDPKSGTITVTVQNTAVGPDGKGGMKKYQPFVSGNIGLGTSRQSMQRYSKPIQPFHKDRGWNPAVPIIQKFYLLSVEKAEEILGKIIVRIIEGR